MRIKYLLFILALVFLPVATWAETHTAASCSYADVLTAYNAASPGDIVEIPAGNCSWSSTFIVDKEIAFQGAGVDSTQITAVGNVTLIKIDLNSDVAVRITGIHFKYSINNTGGVAVYIRGKKDGSLCLTQIRVDHNKFEKGTRTVYARGWLNGVIDNNTFINCNIAVGITGDNDESWDRPIEAGTADCLFIENNTFIVNNDTDREPNEQIYHQEGGRTVIRYNTFDGTAYTGNFLFLDTHGNWPYYSDPTHYRGQPIIEVYNNTINFCKSYRLMNLRGGSILFYNNTMTKETSPAADIKTTEEESWQTALFDPKDGTWPAEDQIMNSFFWGNTSNGNLLTDIAVKYRNDEIFILKDRDYFMHAPGPTGGKSVYTGRQGAAGNGTDGTLTFSATGPNAYYPYTPYTYPHPLRYGTSTPGTPSGLERKKIGGGIGDGSTPVGIDKESAGGK